MPNLVQTLEGTPAFIHGGPFANIAHGCNSVIATNLALRSRRLRGDGGGLRRRSRGGEILRHQVPPGGPEAPSAAVIVATVRALKMHGGLAKADLSKENLDALKKGMANLGRHIENVREVRGPADRRDQRLHLGHGRQSSN